jgi:transaldolase
MSNVKCTPQFYVKKRDVNLRTPGLHLLCQIVDPDFDSSRLVTKIPTTWEGVQAARQLKPSGIKTLATTLFSMEQVILAGEAGCISISPFVHELKTETYNG